MKRDTVETVIGDLGLVGLFLWLSFVLWHWVTSPLCRK